MKANIINKNFQLEKNNNVLSIKAFDVTHGLIKSTGYVIDKIGYISDCNKVPKQKLKYLKSLNYLILDCLKIDKHPSHFNFDEAINLINLVKPKKAILTNLHTDLDYFKLKKNITKKYNPSLRWIKF